MYTYSHRCICAYKYAHSCIHIYMYVSLSVCICAPIILNIKGKFVLIRKKRKKEDILIRMSFLTMSRIFYIYKTFPLRFRDMIIASTQTTQKSVVVVALPKISLLELPKLVKAFLLAQFRNIVSISLRTMTQDDAA